VFTLITRQHVCLCVGSDIVSVDFRQVQDVANDRMYSLSYDHYIGTTLHETLYGRFHLHTDCPISLWLETR
jgi:hypothetical protein